MLTRSDNSSSLDNHTRTTSWVVLSTQKLLLFAEHIERVADKKYKFNIILQILLIQHNTSDNFRYFYFVKWINTESTFWVKAINWAIICVNSPNETFCSTSGCTLHFEQGMGCRNNYNSKWLKVKWPKQSMSKHSAKFKKSEMYLAVTATHYLMNKWNRFRKLRESWVLSKTFLQKNMIVTELNKLSRWLSLYRIKTWRWEWGFSFKEIFWNSSKSQTTEASHR